MNAYILVFRSGRVMMPVCCVCVFWSLTETSFETLVTYITHRTLRRRWKSRLQFLFLFWCDIRWWIARARAATKTDSTAATHTHMVTCMHMVWRWCGACVNHCSCVCNFYAVTAAVQCTYMRRLRRQNGNDDDDIIIFVCWPVSRNRQPLSNLLSIVDSSRIFFFLPCIN